MAETVPSLADKHEDLRDRVQQACPQSAARWSRVELLQQPSLSGGLSESTGQCLWRLEGFEECSSAVCETACWSSRRAACRSLPHPGSSSNAPLSVRTVGQGPPVWLDYASTFLRNLSQIFWCLERSPALLSLKWASGNLKGPKGHPSLTTQPCSLRRQAPLHHHLIGELMPSLLQCPEVDVVVALQLEGFSMLPPALVQNPDFDPLPTWRNAFSQRQTLAFENPLALPVSPS